jgi:hypothetical protein
MPQYSCFIIRYGDETNSWENFIYYYTFLYMCRGALPGLRRYQSSMSTIVDRTCLSFFFYVTCYLCPCYKCFWRICPSLRFSSISDMFLFHILRTDRAGCECGLLQCEIAYLARHLPIFWGTYCYCLQKNGDCGVFRNVPVHTASHRTKS